MFKNKEQIFLFIITILISSFVTFIISLAWTEPISNPPLGNIAAPLNISKTGQTKLGGLILNTGGAPIGLIVENGKVGIGTRNPLQKLDVVGGYIRSDTGFCIRDNCITSWPSFQTPLSVSCYASPNPANTNQTVTFYSNVSGGTGNYTYNWSGACTGSSSYCSRSFSYAGTYTANLSVTSGNESRTTSCSVTINQPQPSYPPLSVSCYASPNPANTNQTVTFYSNVSGGTGNYTYNWSGACTGSSSSCSRSFSSAGTYTANLSVTSGNESRTTSCSVTINQPQPQGCSGGFANGATCTKCTLKDAVTGSYNCITYICQNSGWVNSGSYMGWSYTNTCPF
jgi:hypothetical protein